MKPFPISFNSVTVTSRDLVFSVKNLFPGKYFLNLYSEVTEVTRSQNTQNGGRP
jgi:hypothetical protein